MKPATRLTLAVGIAAALIAELALGVSVFDAHASVAAVRHIERDEKTLVAHADVVSAHTAVRLANERGNLATHRREQQRAQTTLAAATTAQQRAAKVLTVAQHSSAAAGSELASVQTCVRGINTATIQSAAANPAAATDALRGAQAACTEVRASEGDNAAYPFDFGDPSVLRDGDTFYAYATNSVAGNVPTIRSTDLVHWTIIGDVLPTLPAWAMWGGTWAPAVVRVGNQYALYYTVRDAATWSQCISVAFASTPAGPFVDDSTSSLMCQPNIGGSIDPRPFVDDRGGLWLVWSAGDNKAMPATIWSQPLTRDGRAVAGTAAMLVHADRTWEDGVTEAPALVAAGGRLWLFYSGNHWNTAGYAVGAARCAGPAGPCTKESADPAFASHDAIAGPGTADFFTTSTGDLWMTYDAYSVPNVGYPSSRLLRFTRVDINDSGVTFAP